MKYIAVVIILLGFVAAHGQGVERVSKPAIDTSVFGKWPHLGVTGISSDGNYIFYEVVNNIMSTTIVKSVDGRWQKQYDGAFGFQFIYDYTLLLFRRADSLFLLHLGTDSIESIAHVGGALLFQDGFNSRVLYGVPGSRVIKILDIATRKEQMYQDVEHYQLNEAGSVLLLARIIAGDSSQVSRILSWVDLHTGAETALWRSTKDVIDHMVFDRSGLQLAFLVHDTTGGRDYTSLWYYSLGSPAAIQLLNDRSKGVLAGESISGDPQFSMDGSRIFFILRKPGEKREEPIGRGTQVDVWNYKDVLLQSQQLVNTKYSPQPRTLLALVDVPKGSLAGPGLIRLGGEGDKLLTPTNTVTGDYLLVANYQQPVDMQESWWNPAARPSVQLVSLRDGKRQVLRYSQQPSRNTSYALSPGGKFLLCFGDPTDKDTALQWYSYELGTSTTRCLTKNVPVAFNVEMDEYDMPISHLFPYQRWNGQVFAGWVVNNETVLVYDRFDVWALDPTGKSRPFNLTEGYGRKHQVRLSIMNSKHLWQLGDTLMLQAMDIRTKESGYFIKVLGKAGLRKLFMGPFKCDDVQIVAKKDNDLLAVLETAVSPPNCYKVGDGKIVAQLSDIQPQKKYNWLTDELVNWTTSDGRPGMGILYKPENFDSTQKYPLILHYYEQKSDQLHEFIYPEFTQSEINIPYFVSRGYLIFIPDIHYKIQEPGASALNYIVSAGKMLIKRSYVDGRHIGLQGHSFGGYQTQFVITHSNLFAAAMSGSGWPNFISRYGSLIGVKSGEFTTETKRSRIGATLWERPDLYIKNSPIFYVDKITTPLLMMNNKQDDQVPFTQGIEMFTAMRRLGKKAWMLQYDNGNHIAGEANAIDYTIRVDQFFDHYLKGKPAPKWMVEGIPATMKGIDAGYELMPGREP